MKTWDGIRRDSDATGDGAWFALNPGMSIEGELGRRGGLVAFTAQSGTAFTNFWSSTQGYYAVFATSTGSVVSVATP